MKISLNLSARKLALTRIFPVYPILFIGRHFSGTLTGIDIADINST